MKRKTVKAAASRTNMKPIGASASKSAPKAGAGGASSSYGPASGNQWTLDAGRVSLLRKPQKPVVLDIAASPQDLRIDLARSALIVVDMQNDFCHAEGWFGQKGIDVRPMRRPIAKISSLTKVWRKAGGTVVWLNWGVRADQLNLSPTLHFKSRRSGQETHDTPGYAERSPIDHGPALVPGEWGAQVVQELAVEPGDITVFKHRLSGFWDNELDSVLRQQGVTTLLFAGINTDRCVFSTLQDAGFLGYDCVLLKDVCSTPSPAYVSRAIHFLVEKLHGFVSTARSITQSLQSPSSTPSKGVRS
jgi:nicotinamidase-related amidase